MREIVHGLQNAKRRVSLLAGREVTLVVNRGRNKIEKLHNVICFPDINVIAPN